MHPFQSIPTIDDEKKLLDLAFSRAKKMPKFKPKDPIIRKKIEAVHRIGKIRDILTERLLRYIKAFPSFNSLPIFYMKLAELTLEVGQVRHSLGALNWAVKQISDFGRVYSRDVKKTETAKKILELQNAYYGRVSSVINKLKVELKTLENARKTIRSYPIIKEGFTVCIVGFPNVGKSTLLGKLTGAKPQVESYAFTTKSLNLGYLDGIQLIDTPGSLNRLDKMNMIEKQAELAMKHLADAFISVIDLTEPYNLKMQMELHRKILRLDKPTVIYLSKTDLLDKQATDRFVKTTPVIKSIEGLKKHIKGLLPSDKTVVKPAVGHDVAEHVKIIKKNKIT
ncbi:MAG: 50S ribosome-binding GTPase [Nanoarchaeota archaeon]|nr:50S ribosome-binding GTPase [Nanoarchaeota archaeon]